MPVRARRAAEALDFGKCTNPAIVFAAGFDGRKEESFEFVDLAELNHGSALNIGVLTSFACNQFATACKANAAAIAACATASQAASQVSGQCAADAWNNALGVSA